jgi:hypothetical protein
MSLCGLTRWKRATLKPAEKNPIIGQGGIDFVTILVKAGSL